MLYRARRALCNLGALGILTIKKAKRVLLKSGLTGVAKALAPCGEVIGKGAAVVGTALLTAYGIDVELYVLKSESRQYCVCKRDRGRIGRGAKATEHLGTELIELTASARLRLLVAEAGDEIVILKRHSVRAFTVLDNSSRDGCRALGTKRNAPALVSVLEGVHLLLYYVGGVTNASYEELGVLKGRRSYLAKAVFLCLLAHYTLYVSPKRCLAWKNIHRAFNLLYHFHLSFRREQFSKYVQVFRYPICNKAFQAQPQSPSPLCNP